MHFNRFLLLLALPLLAGPPASADASHPENAVLVIGALHNLHEREPAFGYEQLRAAIVTFAPDVLVLEVRPDELAAKKPTPGRPEYPAVIWPLLEKMNAETVPMEPGGELFKTITGEAGAVFEKLRQNDPEGMSALTRLNTAADDIFLKYWECASQSQDEITATMANGLQAAQAALAGPTFISAQARWDGYMAAQALHAVRTHPDKRIMVIASFKNRAMLYQILRGAAPERVLDTPEWSKQVVDITLPAACDAEAADQP